MTARGSSGVTHCGEWVPWRAGEHGIWMTRLVCTLSAGHIGDHVHGTTGYSWPVTTSASGRPSADPADRSDP